MTPDLLTYEIDPQVTAFSTKRHGGYGQGNYAEFNVNWYCGDDTQSICRNRQMLCSFLAIEESRLVMPHQTHQTQVRNVDASFFLMEKEEQTAVLEGVDAVMTSLKNVCIGVSTADCIPILLYDTEHHAAAAIHAGWRGTVKRIAMIAVNEMKKTYHSAPGMLKAVIGPGISLDSFEVGDEVYEQFREAGFPMEQIASSFPVQSSTRQHTKIPQRGGLEGDFKWHIDLWECNRRQLMEAGIPCQQIHLAGVCTYQHDDEYFSARKLGIHSGRILTGIVLR